MQEIDAVAFVNGFDARWNAHDEDGTVELFAEDPVVRLSPPPPPPLREIFRGRAEAREFVRALLPGFHVESTGQTASGDTVTWSFRLSCDALRQMGVQVASGSAAAVVAGGKIRSFQPTFDAETVGRLQAAAGHGPQ